MEAVLAPQSHCAASIYVRVSCADVVAGTADADPAVVALFVGLWILRDLGAATFSQQEILTCGAVMAVAATGLRALSAIAVVQLLMLLADWQVAAATRRDPATTLVLKRLAALHPQRRRTGVLPASKNLPHSGLAHIPPPGLQCAAAATDRFRNFARSWTRA